MANSSVGQVDIDLLLNDKKFNAHLEKTMSKANKTISSGMDSGIGKITSSLGKIGGLVAGAFAVKEIIGFGKECAELGSNLQEVQNVVDSTFGSMSEDINSWAKQSIELMGMSETSAKKYAGTFGAMSKAFGYGEKEAADMAKSITQLTADVASFYNLDYDAAYTKLKSIYTGETESLKDLGVVMTQNALDQFALANGYGKTTKEMTEQEKVALRYKFVFNQLSTAQGDFARTSDSFANQTKKLTENFNALKTTIGQGLIQALTPVIKMLNILIERLQIAAQKFADFMNIQFGGGNSSGGGGAGSIASDLSDISGIGDSAAEAVSGIGDECTETAKKAKKLTFGFDELNKLEAPDDGSSGISDDLASGISDVGLIQDETKANEENNKVLDNKKSLLQEIGEKAIQTAKEVGGSFKAGFELSFSGTDFISILEDTKNKALNIVKNIKDIFDEPIRIKMFDTLLNTAKTLGQILGSISKILFSFVNFVLGTIDKFLSDNKQLIHDTIDNVLDSFNSILDSIGSIFTDIGDIISDFLTSEYVQQLGANILSIIIDPLMAGFDIFLEDLSVFLEGIATIIHDNKDKIEEVINGLVSFLLSITTTIKETIDSLITKVKEVNEQYIKPSIEAIMNSLNDLVSSVLTSWTTYIQPILDEFAEIFDKVMKQYVEPMLESTIELIGVVVDALTQLWVNVLQPICKWLVDTLFKTIKWIWDNTKGVIETAVATVSTLIKGVIDTFSGLIQFLTGVFTGDVQKTSDGLKKIGQGLYEFFHDGILKFDEFVEQVGQLLINFVKDSIMLVVNFIADKINEGMEKSKEQMNNLHDWFVEKFTKIKEDFFNFGANIIDGFIGGIKDTWEKAKDTVGELADGIKDKFKDLLGIHSPSRVFKEFGRYLDEGLEIGIKTNADDIYSQVSSLSDNIQANFTPRLAFLGKEENSSSTPQITYPGGASSSNEAVIMQQNARIIELLEAINNKETDLYMDTNKVGKLVTKYQQNEARRLS